AREQGRRQTAHRRGVEVRADRTARAQPAVRLRQQRRRQRAQRRSGESQAAADRRDLARRVGIIRNARWDHEGTKSSEDNEESLYKRSFVQILFVMVVFLRVFRGPAARRERGRRVYHLARRTDMMLPLVLALTLQGAAASPSKDVQDGKKLFEGMCAR